LTPRVQLIRAIERIWSDKGIVSTMLLPFSWLTQFVVGRKIARYKKNPGLIWKSNRPIIVIGNIYVGGTGKTPVVIALVEFLTQCGWHPGVVSRGYGVQIGSQARTGQGALDAGQFGDESALIARTTGAPVSVHPSRVKAGQALLENYPDVDVIVADDGLQHLALGRDIEIIVQDTRGIGNGRLLPAGPLREPSIKLTQVDAVVTNGQTNPDAGPITTFQTTDTGTGPVHVCMTLAPLEAVHVKTGRSYPWAAWLSLHSDTPLSAVAAIGHPERFFTMLRRQGLTVQNTRALPDHTAYTPSAFSNLGTQIILITTKDAVKCAGLNDDRLWAVRVVPKFSEPDWLDRIHDSLIKIAERKHHDGSDDKALN